MTIKLNRDLIKTEFCLQDCHIVMDSRRGASNLSMVAGVRPSFGKWRPVVQTASASPADGAWLPLPGRPRLWPGAANGRDLKILFRLNQCPLAEQPRPGAGVPLPPLRSCDSGNQEPTFSFTR